MISLYILNFKKKKKKKKKKKEHVDISSTASQIMNAK